MSEEMMECMDWTEKQSRNPKQKIYVPKKGESVLDYVLLEMERQVDLWGIQDHNPFTYLSILGEEIGECHKAALESYNWEEGIWNTSELKHLREELIQVSAVACSMVESLNRLIDDEQHN